MPLGQVIAHEERHSRSGSSSKIDRIRRAQSLPYCHSIDAAGNSRIALNGKPSFFLVTVVTQIDPLL